MIEQDKNKWSEVTSGKLSVAKQHFHHHAFEILTTHKELRDNISDCLKSDIFIETSVRRTINITSKGIKAKTLNSEIRNLFQSNLQSLIKFEVNEEKGVFYFSSTKGSIGGFDFAILNHTKNIISLRNLCFGELHYHEGEKRWSEFLKKNEDLLKIAEELKDKDSLGTDSVYKISDKDTPLIVGEIQFGNWALVYRDFFKVLKANVQNSIDCLVYIVPTGKLESMLSGGIVTYDKTVKILNEFEKVISVPVWVIGIDITLDE